MKTLYALVALFGMSSLVCATEPHHRFTWDTLLAASIKYQKGYNYEAITDSYLQVFEPTVWSHVKEDEFKLRKERKRVIEQCQQEVKDFSLDRNVHLHTWLNLGNYNFDTESFPVTNMNESYHWSEYRYRSGGFPSTFCLYLANPDLLASLPMSPENAEAFLNRRKDGKGRINRRVEVTLRIRLTGLRPRSRTDLFGEIQSATLYHNRAQKLVLREIIKPKMTGATEPNEATATEAKPATAKPEPIETQTAP